MLLIIAVNATVTGGLFPMVAPGYVLVIVISGMLLGSRGRFTITAVAAVMWIITQSIIARGFVPQTPLPDPIGTVSVQIIIALVFVFIGILSQLATSDLRRSLDEATYDLVQANRKLEEANRLKSQFMARTSHELRTPLSSIVAYSDLVLREAYGPLTPKQKDRVARVLQSARHLTTLINDLLNLAKIEAGELEIVETLFPVNDLAETVRSTLETAAHEKELAFTVSLAPDMPEQIVGDQGRLCQVLINLASNAIKFTDEGSVTVSIKPADEKRWQMVVADTGRGIHEKHLQSIFEEFHQVNLSDTDKLRGVGLGLAITRQLVKLMAGEIHVTSELGKGSTFEVILPLMAGAGK
jgi:signal transduction histidine kinase